MVQASERKNIINQSIYETNGCLISSVIGVRLKKPTWVGLLQSIPALYQIIFAPFFWKQHLMQQINKGTRQRQMSYLAFIILGHGQQVETRQPNRQACVSQKIGGHAGIHMDFRTHCLMMKFKSLWAKWTVADSQKQKI